MCSTCGPWKKIHCRVLKMYFVVEYCIYSLYIIKTFSPWAFPVSQSVSQWCSVSNKRKRKQASFPCQSHLSLNIPLEAPLHDLAKKSIHDLFHHFVCIILLQHVHPLGLGKATRDDHHYIRLLLGGLRRGCQDSWPSPHFVSTGLGCRAGHLASERLVVYMKQRWRRNYEWWKEMHYFISFHSTEVSFVSLLVARVGIELMNAASRPWRWSMTDKIPLCLHTPNPDS